jgi:2-hydroxy-3-keto-5-methylthiopentenyl-1-phosphate phosphatase
MPGIKKTAVQIDFDGTVTEEDVSFMLLDVCLGDAWHEHHRDYEAGRISVGTFNRRVFSLVKEDRPTLTRLVLTSERVRIRPGFRELIEYCRKMSYRTVIVSNGLEFYIRAILENLGIAGVEVHAAENTFFPGGVAVRYLGPDGVELEAGFKEAYTDMLRKQGYEVVYIGDGNSDIHPARLARRVFATAQLLERCREDGLTCEPFKDFFDVIRGLEKLAGNGL